MLYAQHKKLSSLTRGCNLSIFTANKTITNPTQNEVSQEESNLLKAGLYFSIQQDKIQKSEIFTTFEKIHHSFINNLKFKETKACLLYLANSYFYNYKPPPCILRQQCILQNLRKNQDIIITKSSAHLRSKPLRRHSKNKYRHFKIWIAWWRPYLETWSFTTFFT